VPKRLKPFDVFSVVRVLSAIMMGDKDMDRNRRQICVEGREQIYAQQSDVQMDSLRRKSTLPLRQDQQTNLLPVWKVDRDRIRDGDRAGR
jgi:hypothetical protein